MTVLAAAPRYRRCKVVPQCRRQGHKRAKHRHCQLRRLADVAKGTPVLPNPPAIAFGVYRLIEILPPPEVKWERRIRDISRRCPPCRITLDEAENFRSRHRLTAFGRVDRK